MGGGVRLVMEFCKFLCFSDSQFGIFKNLKIKKPVPHTSIDSVASYHPFAVHLLFEANLTFFFGDEKKIIS